MSYKINYKPLLPKELLTVLVNTKTLPNKGNLVYEYNPFRNYRLNETKYLYQSKFYTEQELMNSLNIIPNVIYINEDKTYTKVVIAKYYGEFQIHSIDDISLKYHCTTFLINNINVSLPPFDNTIKDFYISEDSILNNGEETQVKVVYEDETSYLQTTNERYVIGYDLENNIFLYGDKLEASNAKILGIDTEYMVSKGIFPLIKFHYKSDKFYLITYDSVYEINEQITKFHPGSIVDFSTNELNFSLSHPVLLLPLYAYDGSVNLIMSDGYSKPKLINSRFSATGKNTYLIVDRKGNNDTNIYNQGTAFDIDTSLYKLTSYIPKLKLKSVYLGGLLSVGGYHFYITYSDADGNETDFVAESGLVSLFLGTDVYSIRQGFRNENSFKGVKLGLSNIDPGYSYINVYYTRCTGDIMLNADTLAFKLTKPIFINNTEELEINITGYEETQPISLADINPAYHIVESAETITASNNMLFLGNVKEATPNYADLADLALYFTPVLDTSELYKNLNKSYSESSFDTYYDPNYIYNKVGYWPEEIYRFGIVFIQHDNTLTPVFNVRGINDLSEDGISLYTKTNIYDEQGNRKYIDINENTNLLMSGDIALLENNKGVVRLHSNKLLDYNPVYGIKFQICSTNKQDVINELKKVCKGYFFVRLRRIPTVLCEAMTIGVDKQSHHPTLPTNGDTLKDIVNKKTHRKNSTISLPNGQTSVVTDPDEILEFCPYSKFKDKKVGYVLESFMNMHREIVNNFEERIRVLGESLVDVKAMICPDYDINYPYYNSIFNGAEFSLLKSPWQPDLDSFTFDVASRHFYIDKYVLEVNEVNNEGMRVDNVKILGVEDSTPLVGIGEQLYSGVAGISNMGYKFDYIGNENKRTDADNLIRGLWGPFLAIDSKTKLRPCDTYMIMIPGYDPSLMDDYFRIRYADKNAYYTISERFSLDDLEDNETVVIYRGDCYICQFTHRMNRNFNDDSAPYNDLIVNKGTWRGDNNGLDENNKPNPGFEVEDGVVKIENFTNINLGDINAVTLGHWVTFLLRSSFNLNIRALDESDVNEVVKLGHGKGFYPYFPMSALGSYKTKEALCVNKGYEKSVADRYSFTYPDIPAQKNCFVNRILHSLPSSNDAFKNGYRVFLKTSFLDYQMTYGSISKILEYKESLLIIFEHGIGLAGINDKALLTNALTSNVYLQTNKVLPKELTIVSDCYGSLWKDSIIKTPYAVYGVDTTAKKIWKFSEKGLELISDRTVQQFLNKNISLTERELDPILGLRNVKTHYNKFKNDVMFTFYDDLENVLEKVWNICYNENMLQFVTFYSWVPSYSDNINNSYFSFDRLTSKWITKLGISNKGNDFAQGITIYDGSSILPDKSIKAKGTDCKFGKLGLSNINYSSIKNFKVLRDNLLNFKLFDIVEINGEFYLTLSNGTNAIDLVSELYYRTSDGEKQLAYDPRSYQDTDTSYTQATLMRAIYNSFYYPIKCDSTGRRVELPNPINKNKIAYIINLECEYETLNGGLKTFLDSITVTLLYNLQFLSTDFWRHGLAGTIDISEKLKPTHWYGKQHPFEFEFIVSLNLANLKIFDNLIILSNHAEPESFHYEIDGDCYEFSKDKPNMYYRLEATEAFYLYNGLDIEYDYNFTDVKDLLQHTPLYSISKESDSEHDYKEYFKDMNVFDENGNKLFVKSNLLSLYYSRINSYNEVEDYYRQQISANKNYDTLSGAEVVWDEVTNTYKIWSHAKAVNVNGAGGRLRGNMLYNEDRWTVLINPLNIRLKNETEWNNDVPPIVTMNSPIQDLSLRLENGNLMIGDYPLDLNNILPEVLKDQGYTNTSNLDLTSWDYTLLVKLRDKYIRIRIRYSGKELAIILAVLTLFRLSYS